ncbi:MAG: hypothetical protein WD768_00555 [Phycisphaeraceae bacterium]
MNHLPSPNGDNGRDAGGRFAKGNAGGPGNPHARRVAHLRARIVEAVTDDDLADIVATLVRCAKAGEPWAVRELLDRCLGKSKPAADDIPEHEPAQFNVLAVPIVERIVTHRPAEGTAGD